MRGIDLLGRDLSELSAEEYSHLAAVCEQTPHKLRREGCVVVAPTVSEDVRRMCRSELGSRPRSLVDVLGLADSIRDYVLEKIEPRCGQCDCDAVPPKTLEVDHLPQNGVIALSVIDLESEITLQERASLLGVERVCVDGHLMLAADVTQEEGEPVLCAVGVKDIQELKEISNHWFTRGGKDLRILHFTSRDSVASELGILCNFWSCPQCGRTLPKLPRTLEQDSPVCTKCRGEGWIVAREVADTQRWVACRDCDALGFRTELSQYLFHGLKLWQVLALSFAELRALVTKDTPAHEIIPMLSAVCVAGLGNHPMGATYDLCSPMERIAITLAQLHLARLENVQAVFDGVYGELAVLPENADSSVSAKVTRLDVGSQSASSLRLAVPDDAPSIVIRDISQGTLCVEEVSFPRGAVTAICGPAGAGKSLLLKIIQKRFSQRRKQAHVASFGNLQHCWFVEGVCDNAGTLLTVLNFAQDLAAEIARTRRAKELGILATELELPRSKYRCERCLGGERVDEGSICLGCQGSLYDWRVAELPLLGATVREIMATPISQLTTKLWANSGVEALLRALVELGAADLSLATPASMISPPLRRILRVCATLARIGSSGSSSRSSSNQHDLDNSLILLDGPRVLPRHYEESLAKSLHVLSQRGATILYASPPKGLESCCQSVVRLEWQTEDVRQRVESRYLDRRFGRKSAIVI